jgi:hypothetical protein
MSSRTLKGNRFSLIALFKFSAPALNANGKGAGNETNKVVKIFGWFGKAMSH